MRALDIHAYTRPSNNDIVKVKNEKALRRLKIKRDYKEEKNPVIFFFFVVINFWYVFDCYKIFKYDVVQQLSIIIIIIKHRIIYVHVTAGRDV